jgi:type 1 fimbriae regulatory protein FimB
MDNQKYLTEDEMKLLLKTVKNFYRNDSDKNFRNFVLIRVCYLHGLRISEALNLHWGDMNFDDRSVIIRRLKGSITTNQLMKDDEMKQLKKLKKLYNLNNNDLVFCNSDKTMVCRQTINLLLKHCSKIVGKKITPHTLKHTCGVHLALSGKNIREIQYHLGHKDYKNTMIYLDYKPQGDANSLNC